MSAPARRPHAAFSPVVPQHIGSQDAGLARLRDVWWEATKIRQEWLGHGLCTEPADRSAAEHHLTATYARLGRARPEFVWVDSPARAIPLVAGWPTLDQVYAWIRDRRPRARPPLASDLAMVAARLRAGLSAGVAHADPELVVVRKGKQREPWPERPPLDALEEGIPLGVVLHQGIRGALHRSLAHGIAHPIRDGLAAAGPFPVCWYGPDSRGQPAQGCPGCEGTGRWSMCWTGGAVVACSVAGEDEVPVVVAVGLRS